MYFSNNIHLLDGFLIVGRWYWNYIYPNKQYVLAILLDRKTVFIIFFHGRKHH